MCCATGACESAHVERVGAGESDEAITSKSIENWNINSGRYGLNERMATITIAGMKQIAIQRILIRCIPDLTFIAAMPRDFWNDCESVSSSK